MSIPYRLTSASMFMRPEEINQVKPARIVFLSVEGNVTEKDYFKCIEKFKAQLGVSAMVHIEVLSRANGDTMSDPVHVLELLEEYMVVRDNGILPEELKKVIPERFDITFVKQYLYDDSSIDPHKKNKFRKELQHAGIDLAYLKFLRDYKGEDDIFGIVIDRDMKNHSEEQMTDIIRYCENKEYKCYISNPCFEFWLLLHLSDVSQEFCGKEKELLVNAKQNSKHTYISKEISERAGHNKRISEKRFCSKYLSHVNTAISRSKDFETNPEKLIYNIGTNLGDLLEMLRNE